VERLVNPLACPPRVATRRGVRNWRKTLHSVRLAIVAPRTRCQGPAWLAVRLTSRRSGARSDRPALLHSTEIVATVRRFIGSWPKLAGAGGGNRTHTGKSPTNFHTRYGFRRHPPPLIGLGRLWSGLSLHRASANRRLGAARLVSTPSPGAFAPELGSGSPSDRVPRI
jgi:hypothetical protein